MLKGHQKFALAVNSSLIRILHGSTLLNKILAFVVIEFAARNLHFLIVLGISASHHYCALSVAELLRAAQDLRELLTSVSCS